MLSSSYVEYTSQAHMFSIDIVWGIEEGQKGVNFLSFWYMFTYAAKDSQWQTTQWNQKASIHYYKWCVSLSGLNKS